MANFTKGDLAYAAGIIDGEGCIYVEPARHRVRVQVGMVETEVTTWLHETFGGTLQAKPAQRSTWRAQTVWIIHSQKVRAFLEFVLLYLKLKGRQAELAIQLEGRKLLRGQKMTQSEWDARDEIMDEIRRLKRVA